jgi:hypothetical protein
MESPHYSISFDLSDITSHSTSQHDEECEELYE